MNHSLAMVSELEPSLTVGAYDDTILGLIDQLASEAHARGRALS